MEYYFECYGDLSLQRTMVSDHPRTDAFASAIREVITGNETVLDVGTGTGLLAMLAAKAGAGKVYGVDQATVVSLARQLVEANGLLEKVKIVEGDARKVDVGEPVDVLVSEWLGHFGFAETMLDDVLAARDRHLKPGGIMLPSHVSLLLAPVAANEAYHGNGPGFWRNPVHGIDYSMLEQLEVEQGIARKADVPKETLLAPGQELFTLDLARCHADDPWQRGSLEVVFERDGTFDGFLGWFSAQLSPSVVLDTGPLHPYTHWEQSHFFLPPREVAAGDTMQVRYALNRHQLHSRCLEFLLTIDDEERYEFLIE